jgi:hypothetical protein
MASKLATAKARIRVIFMGNSWSASSAFSKVTFVGDPPLQLSCDYY